MEQFKKRLPLFFAIIIIAIIIALPIFLKGKNKNQPQTAPLPEILGEITTPTPSPITSLSSPLSPTPRPKPVTASTNSPVTILPAVSPTQTPVPTPTPVPAKTITVEIQNLGTYTVEIGEHHTAYDALINAGKQNGFSVTSEYYAGMGYFVTGIGGVLAHDNFFWAFYYNGVTSMVGASSQIVSDGDTTAWKFESW